MTLKLKYPYYIHHVIMMTHAHETTNFLIHTHRQTEIPTLIDN